MTSSRKPAADLDGDSERGPLTLALALKCCGVKVLFETSSAVPDHSLQAIESAGVRVSTSCRAAAAVHAASASWLAGHGICCVCTSWPQSPGLLAAVAQAGAARSALILLVISVSGSAGEVPRASDDELGNVCKQLIYVDGTTDAPNAVMQAAVAATTVVVRLNRSNLASIGTPSSGQLACTPAAARRIRAPVNQLSDAEPAAADDGGHPSDPDVAAVLGAVMAPAAGSLPVVVCSQPGRCAAAALRHLRGCRLLQCTSAGAAAASGLGISLGSGGQVVTIGKIPTHTRILKLPCMFFVSMRRSC